MINYKFDENIKDKNNNNINFTLDNSCVSHIDDKGWGKFKINASIDSKNVGYIEITNITESEFDKNYDIFSFLELRKGYDLDYHDKKDNNILFKDINKIVKMIDESIIDLLTEEDRLFLLKKIMTDYEYKFEDEYLEFKDDTINKSMVDYIFVDKDLRENKIGSAIYKAAGLFCSYNKQPLYESYSQQDNAVKSWDSMKRDDNMPTKLDKKSNFYFLDFEPELKNKYKKNLFTFKKKIASLTDNVELQDLITIIWARNNPVFGNVFKEIFSTQNKDSFSLFYKDNPIGKGAKRIEVDIAKSKEIKPIVDKLDKKSRKIIKDSHALFCSSKIGKYNA
jgi:hypothetical protein